MGMLGPWMMGGSLLLLVFLFGLAVAGSVWWGRSMTRRKSPSRLEADSAQEELRRRYAAGEIDREEYLQRKIDME
ncbi:MULTISPECIES: SHOCT domain-containing protein [Nocardiopsis]|nr:MULTISPECIES: SHOCT domain-containing protein [Nocardiopsis]MCK9872338.1 SHOCT domain-containing protein [Nocardiopsis dassonvillei]